MVEDNSLFSPPVEPVVVSSVSGPSQQGRVTGTASPQSSETTRVTERGVRVAESAMDPPSLHPEPGRAPWQRRRVLRG